MAWRNKDYAWAVLNKDGQLQRLQFFLCDERPLPIFATKKEARSFAKRNFNGRYLIQKVFINS